MSDIAKLRERFGHLLDSLPETERWEARWIMLLVIEHFVDTYTGLDFVREAEGSDG